MANRHGRLAGQRTFKEGANIGVAAVDRQSHAGADKASFGISFLSVVDPADAQMVAGRDIENCLLCSGQVRRWNQQPTEITLGRDNARRVDSWRGGDLSCLRRASKE